MFGYHNVRCRVPRYFFDLTDGSREPDLVGTQLPDEHAAERMAIRFLGEVLKHEPERLSAGPLRVNVREEDDGYRCIIATSVERR